MTILDTYDKLHQDGEITLKQAQEFSINQLSRIRFSHNEYIWINDTKGWMVLHPDQTLHNKDGLSIRDGAGRSLIKEFIDLTKDQALHAVEYQWIQPGSSEYTRKVSYVKLYSKWGWVVGTGIHTTDITRMFIHLFMVHLFVAVAVIVVMFFLLKCLTKALTNTVRFDK